MAIEIPQSRPASRTPRATSLLQMRIGGGEARLSAADRRFFTERLALLLETGTPLHAALQTLSRQSRGEAFGTMVGRLHDDVTGGMPFAQALARQGDTFPSTYINLVAASESGGFLDEVLKRLAEMDERNAELSASIRSSLFYPAFLVVFSSFVVVFVLTVVFPKFETLFAGIADELPVTTLVLMATSRFLREQWPLVSVAVLVLAALLWWWFASERGAAGIDRLKLRVPGVRELFAQFYLGRVMRVMSLSLSHGVSVPDALRACRGLIANREFDRFLAEVETDVEEGRGITPAFNASPFVPDMVRQMVATGEQAARLPLVMGRVADFYERELTRRLNTLSKLVEPVMLLVMGTVVGLLVSSIILPIFKLSRIAH